MNSKKYNKVAVLELKAELSEEDAENLIELYKKYDYLKKAVFISFKWNNLMLVRKFSPNQEVQFLTDGEMVFTDEFLDKVAENKFDLDIHIWTTTKENIERMQTLRDETLVELKKENEKEKFSNKYGQQDYEIGTICDYTSD